MHTGCDIEEAEKMSGAGDEVVDEERVHIRIQAGGSRGHQPLGLGG